MPYISVIVPVYNASSTIERTAQSILDQNCDDDFELILVNDGSTDGSGDLCDAIARDNGHVRVVHQVNAGVSSARNAGMAAARGQWVTFVDSDDLVLDSFLKSMADASRRDPMVDLVFSCYYVFEEHAAYVASYRSSVYTGIKSMGELLGTSQVLTRCSSWGKLYRRSVLVDVDLKFDEKLHLSEDRLFLYNFLMLARGIATTSQGGYIYSSWSRGSLKLRRNSTDMLAYRQQVMSAAAHRVLDRFDINRNGEGYLITRHLMMILFELVRNAYYEHGLTRKAVNAQNQLFDAYFDVDLYHRNLEDDQRWNALLSSNVLLRCMMEKKFSQMNRTLRWREVDLKLREFAYYKLLRRTDTGSFDNFLKILNQ